MAFFDFDYRSHAYNYVSDRYRNYPIFMKIIMVTLYPIRWYWKNFMSIFVYGNSAAPQWSVGTSYTSEAVVKYGGSLFVSLADSNIGNVPLGSPKWLFLIDNIVGYMIISKFKPEKIRLEYILNLQFGGVFKQPGSAGVSDIQVLRNAVVNQGYIGLDGSYPSRIGLTDSVFNISLDGIYTPQPSSITLKVNPANNFDKVSLLNFAYKFATIGVTINIQ